MKKKGLSLIIIVAFATLVGFVSGDMKDPNDVNARDSVVSMTVEEAIDLEKECLDNDISFEFVENVIETDESYGVPVDKETIVDELVRFFKIYEDPYAVLMCHHYNESVAKTLTGEFTKYVEDQYVEAFYEIERKNMK